MRVSSILLSLILCHCEAFHSHYRSSHSESYSSLFSSRKEASAAASTSSTTTTTSGDDVPSFLMQAFGSECDDVNRPPSLNILLRSLKALTYSGSDIRGFFVDHPRRGSVAAAAHAIGKVEKQPPLTPFAAHCFGYALASMVKDYHSQRDSSSGHSQPIRILIGHDPRTHGMALTDAFSRGAMSVDNVQVYYTGLATTPGIATLCNIKGMDAGVCVTASHLPPDRNGFKLFTSQGGFTKPMLRQLYEYSVNCANEWYTRGILPPTSGKEAVSSTGWVDWMPEYATFLQQSVIHQVGTELPLQGLKIVMNAGNGAGGFFADVCERLGASVVALGCEGDGDFPDGVPNPEYKPMMEKTIEACKSARADLGIMLDTDADRCGFIARTTSGDYEPINRNRLIALLGYLLSSTKPHCTIVTDSVTSEGLATFLTERQLSHYRFIKGYANVINKAKELDAELAIETSGHSAFRENNYMDDGTYTAVEVLGLLAKEKKSLLDLISDLDELDEVAELRLSSKDENVETMAEIFDLCALIVEGACAESKNGWRLDAENLEGIRVSLTDNQFFMVRKSLHDPIISVQVEATSKSRAQKEIVEPLLALFQKEERVVKEMDLKALTSY